jgi:RNA recognition motif-containing protein
MLPALEASSSLNRPKLQDTAKKSTEIVREGKKRAPPLDQRRNLYVLGIPQHISLEQFTDLFSDFGVVSHAVILAVLDAFSRRRGFVVMSNNEEASLAMKRMSGAVVQSVHDSEFSVLF